MGLLFSERYEKLLNDESFISDIDLKNKSNLMNIIYSYDEPGLSYPDRFNPGWGVTTKTQEDVLAIFFEKHNFSNEDVGEVNREWYCKRDLYDLFDIIELWYDNLSETYKTCFLNDINSFFEKCKMPWRLASGKIIKIDASQFEQDMANESIEILEQIKCSQPLFQTPYEEFLQAISKFNLGEYCDVVLYACKSYESVIKIILGLKNGNSAELVKEIIASKYIIDFPENLTKKGFEEKVLSSLPYIRNKLPAGHGAGLNSLEVPKNYAKLSINLAATLNTYLINEYANYMEANANHITEQDEEAEIPF